MNIALCQIDTIVGDLNYNREKIIKHITEATKKRADLVLFPYLAISGAPLMDVVNMPDFIDKCYVVLEDICIAAKNIDVVVGIPVASGGDIFVAAAYISKGEVVEVFSKAMVFDRDELPYFGGIDSPDFYEEEQLSTDEALPMNMISCNGEKILLVLGEDIEFTDSLGCFREGKAPSMIVHLSQQYYTHSAMDNERKQLSDLATHLQIPVVSVAPVGGNTTKVYYGGSAVYDIKGEVYQQLRYFEEDFAILEMFRNLKSRTKTAPTALGKTENTYRILLLGLKDFFTKQGFKKVCLGLSGGIDSAVVAVLATEALGAENVYTYMLPSQFSSDHSLSDSILLAQKLGIHCQQMEIEPIYDSFIKTLAPVFGDRPFSVAEENLQSRIRGVLLMAVSNKLGYLLLNTTNKSESAMGYGTLYGDTNGALSILGDLYKTEVYDLARYINRQDEIIPVNIIDKEPSAELRDQQKDSDSLPPYDLLDAILYQLIEENRSVMEIMSKGFDLEMIQNVARQMKACEHKRQQLPPVLRLSECTLGEDRRIPLVAVY